MDGSMSLLGEQMARNDETNKRLVDITERIAGIYGSFKDKTDGLIGGRGRIEKDEEPDPQGKVANTVPPEDTLRNKLEDQGMATKSNLTTIEMFLDKVAEEVERYRVSI